MGEDFDRDIAGLVRRFVRERQNILASASSTSEVIEPLNDVAELFLRGSLQALKVPLSKRSVLKTEFVNNHFVRFTDFLLSSSIIGFYSNLSEEQKKELFDVFFLRGPPHDSLLVVGDALTKQTSSLKNTQVTVSLLEKFFSDGRVVDLLVQQSRVSRYLANDHHKLSQDVFESKLWEQLTTLIVSFPQRVANKMRQNCSSLFYPDSYFKMIADQILVALEKLHENLSMSHDCSLKFVAQLLGRLCMVGQAEKTFSILLPALEKWLGKSPLWSRICERLITGVPDNTMEHVAEGILQLANSSTLVDKLFGDSVLTNSKLKYLLTTKFLLMRSYTNINILVNIIGYLSGCKQRHLLLEVALKLFDVWSDKSAIKHTTYDQHFYVTCATVLSFGHLNAEEKQTQRHVILTKLLVGVQSHLESPLEKVRRVGMVVAECVTASLEPNGEKLSFEYTEDEETRLLKSLAKGKVNRNFNGKERKKLNDFEKFAKPSANGTTAIKHAADSTAKNASSDDGDNDDDDLLPYDLDEEDDAGDVLKSPKYLRDCIEGLVTSEDPSKTEATLKNIEKIVSASLDDLEDVCVELVKVLLHLQDRYSTDRFYELRHNAMVSVSVRCPQQVSCYLTEEFFAPNYNLQQRLDMLNVLADTAQQLSSPSEIQKIRSVPRKYSFQQVSSSSFDQVVPDWQKIVQERIDKKTKRFAKGPTKPQPKPVANKFSSVAGFFFFPLMKNFDSKVNTLDLLGDDTLILGRLVYTLGIVMYSARETPMARNMGTALLEFAWALKYHEEPFVRQALIFAQAMVAVSVPSSTLLSDTPRELFELHDWLTTVVQTDTDADSVKAALQTLILLEELFKNQVFLHG